MNRAVYLINFILSKQHRFLKARERFQKPSVWEQIFELVLAVGTLILVLPLLIVVAMLIKLDSHGPVLYRGKRVGKDGKIFTIYKFRTLNPGTEKYVGENLLDEKANHVTRIGKILRKTKIDELPQLINILRGEMSLVGPRANRPIYFAHWVKLTPNYAQRLKVKPGLTGLAQIYGSYYTHPRNKLRYDLLYIKNRSWALNLKLISLTALVLLFGKQMFLNRKLPAKARKQKVTKIEKSVSLAPLEH